MAKLYAELSSDKGGRVVSKGGNKHVTARFITGNDVDYMVTVKPHSIVVYDRCYNILYEKLNHYRT